MTFSLNLKEKPFPVHRLDKPTTGALILARNKQTAQTLSHQFQKRLIQKTYLALVHGSFPPGDAGEVQQRLYITDGKVSPRKNSMETPTEERDTLTTWKCLGTSVPEMSGISLLEFGLCTGVKHQLRVVAASALRAPIMGDHIYGSKHISREISATASPRLLLHSARISLIRYLHKPLYGRREYRLEVTAPLPTDFVSTCQKLGIPVDPSWTPNYTRATANGKEVSFSYEEILEDHIIESMRNDGA